MVRRGRRGRQRRGWKGIHSKGKVERRGGGRRGESVCTDCKGRQGGKFSHREEEEEEQEEKKCGELYIQRKAGRKEQS